MALGSRVRWRRVVVLVVGLAAALAARVLFNGSNELLTAADTLALVSAGWVVVAILSEVLSSVMRGSRGGGGSGGCSRSALCFFVGAVTVLTIIAVQIPGNDGPIPGLRAISIALLAALALIGGGYAVLRRPAVRHRIARPLKGSRSALAQPRRRPALGSRRCGGILRRAGAPIVGLRRDWATQNGVVARRDRC
ncbi:MAG: hypothetical protein ACRDRO_08415 [Pseudonocardiaceae bacterium]